MVCKLLINSPFVACSSFKQLCPSSDSIVTLLVVNLSAWTYKLQTQFSQLPVGQNAKFLCLWNRKFPVFLKNHIIFVIKPFPLWVMVIQTSRIFSVITQKAWFSKNRVLWVFLAITPLWIKLEVNVRCALKTTWTELSNEYKNIMIPLWNDWEYSVWIERQVLMIDPVCRTFYWILEFSFEF